MKSFWVLDCYSDNYNLFFYGDKMELLTSRLTIRNLYPDDWKVIKTIWQDFDRSVYEKYDVPHSSDDIEIQKLVRQFSESNDFFLVMLSETKEMIGTVDLHDTGNGYDIGFCFLSKYHGNGYAKESCTALINLYAKNGCKRFSAGTAMENIPSVKLLTSIGFVLIDTEQVTFYKDEMENDIYFEGGQFELLKSIWIFYRFIYLDSAIKKTA